MALTTSSSSDQMIEDFILSQNLSENTVKSYRSLLNNFFRYLNDRELTRKDVAIFVKKEKQKGLADGTIKAKLTVIRCYAKWLWEEDLLLSKEYKKILGLKIKLDYGEDGRRALTEEEIELGYNKLVNPILRMLFWTGLNYGLRRSEYINLKMDDIDLLNRIVTIRHSKGNKTRRIKILKTHVPVWRDWFVTRDSYQLDHDFVFFTDRGRAGTRSIERYFNKISEILLGNKEITSHTLRYTFAVRCWRSEMDLLVLSKILGHSNLRTTQTYLRVIEHEILEKYEEQASRI
ncbi:MAG: tyrosine-type recombinase/integrase [Promethearchaeota archaeon]